jgi:hypothetical protein
MERKKPIEEKAALVAEKDTISAKVEQLERQLIDERTARDGSTPPRSLTFTTCAHKTFAPLAFKIVNYTLRKTISVTSSSIAHPQSDNLTWHR